MERSPCGRGRDHERPPRWAEQVEGFLGSSVLAVESVTKRPLHRGCDERATDRVLQDCGRGGIAQHGLTIGAAEDDAVVERREHHLEAFRRPGELDALRGGIRADAVEGRLRRTGAAGRPYRSDARDDGKQEEDRGERRSGVRAHANHRKWPTPLLPRSMPA